MQMTHSVLMPRAVTSPGCGSSGAEGVLAADPDTPPDAPFFSGNNFSSNSCNISGKHVKILEMYHEVTELLTLSNDNICCHCQASLLVDSCFLADLNG